MITPEELSRARVAGRVFMVCPKCGMRNNAHPDEYLREYPRALENPRPDDYYRCGWVRGGVQCVVPITEMIIASSADDAYSIGNTIRALLAEVRAVAEGMAP